MLIFEILFRTENSEMKNKSMPTFATFQLLMQPVYIIYILVSDLDTVSRVLRW